VQAWRDVVDRAAVEIGPLTPALARHWRTELDDVERRVSDLERSAPALPADDGVHAFVALASARLGDAWDPRQLIDVAAAVELAYRATRHHAGVLNAAARERSPVTARERSPVTARERSPVTVHDGSPVHDRSPVATRDRMSGRNTAAVLDGDWSITQAAVLVSDVGPTAYRLLVRGYGATQLAELLSGTDRLALIQAAVSLGGLIAGVSDDSLARLWVDASNGRAHRSAEAAALAWAVRSQSAGPNAVSVAVPGPIDVHDSRSTTTRPAVGRP
jgi:hypothetical protein